MNEVPSDDEKYFIIINTETSQAWSNEDGWVPADSDGYDLFDEEERKTCNLPIGGRWWDPNLGVWAEDDQS